MTRVRENSWPRVHTLTELCGVLEDPTYACITASANFADSIFRGVSRGQLGPVVLFMTNQATELLKLIPTVLILCSSLSVEEQHFKVTAILCLHLYRLCVAHIK